MPSLQKIAVYVAILAVAYYFARLFFNGGVCYSDARMDNKVVIVTGSNTGIGKESVVDLVNRGAKVYMACRSVNKATAAAQDIKQRTGVTDDRLIVMKLDLSSYDSIREFVKEFKSREQRLDVLMNNAGVMMIQERTLTVDGNEMQFGTNHLGHFLLTNLLLDTLIASAPSRIVTVSSGAHKFVSAMNMDNLNAEKEYGSVGAYGYSKLANIMFSRELGKRLKGTGVTTYSLNPGAIMTDLQRHIPYVDNWFVANFILPIIGIAMKTVPQGTQTQICCAVDEQFGKETGKYYSDVSEIAPTPAAENDADCKELWERSVVLTKLKLEEMVPQVH